MLPLDTRPARLEAQAAAGGGEPQAGGGAVSASTQLATEAGTSLLRSGGNAVDAAVATALALAVAYPEAGNLGGGGFAVVKIGPAVHTLDFRETAPAKATPTLYLDKDGKPLAGASLVGPLASGVPGSPAGLYELHHKLGRLPWAQVVEPAVALAGEGFRVDAHLHDVLAQADSRKLLERFPESAQVWLPGGQPPAPGTVLRLPRLAATLRGYAERGPTAIMTGPVAAAIEAASRRHGGILTALDLADYHPVWREPIRFEAFGWKLATMDLPSAGGIALGQSFGMLEALRWSRLPRGGAERAHLLAETFRRVYADRFVLGDPATAQARAAQLLSPAWIAALARSIDPLHATPSAQVRPWGAPPKGRESGETTHLSVLDREGNLVAMTVTLNGLFGCGLYVPEAGFFLNNEMDDFATAPGRPNLFGLIQGEANAIGPGKRMLSSMTPTVAWRGAEALAIGGRGGSRIPTHLAQALLALLVDHDGLRAAVARPRLHHQWFPDRLEAEPGALAPEVSAELRRRGHHVEAKTDAARIAAVRRLPDGRAEAVLDARAGGTIPGQPSPTDRPPGHRPGGPGGS